MIYFLPMVKYDNQLFPVCPPPVSPGETIGVVSPAGPVIKEQVEKGIKVLERKGYKVKLGNYLYSKNGYLAGSDMDRAEDLNNMMADPKVKTIIFSRGGYGSARILPYLDMDLFIKNPKNIVGFSDVTILLIHVLLTTNMITFHGPMVSNLGENVTGSAADCLFKVLSNERPLNLLKLLNAETDVRVFRQGQASGLLVGGCLSLLQTLTGAEHGFDTSGRILFWEEINENLYRIDRMMEHLSRVGYFRQLSGMIIGKLTHSSPGSERELEQLPKLFERYVGEYDYPVMYNVPLGHVDNQITLPEGGFCYMDTDAPEISLPPVPPTGLISKH